MRGSAVATTEEGAGARLPWALTAAVLTLKETREMASEMLEAQRQWLPQFEGKGIKAAPMISIPKDVVRAEVPVDPALGIMARFGEMGKKE